MLAFIVFGVLAYLIGSLSSAIIVCKFLGLPDPRTEGSMNPGTTNVLRVGGKVPALITLSGDVLKGFLPVLIARMVGIEGFYLGLIAVFAFLGHLYPVFFKFQGGKGVATSFGAILALSPLTGLAALMVWVSMAMIFRYSSLAALTASALAPILILIFSDSAYFLPVLVITAMLIFRHRGNIQRLRAGAESKISF